MLDDNSQPTAIPAIPPSCPPEGNDFPPVVIGLDIGSALLVGGVWVGWKVFTEWFLPFLLVLMLLATIYSGIIWLFPSVGDFFGAVPPGTTAAIKHWNSLPPGHRPPAPVLPSSGSPHSGGSPPYGPSTGAAGQYPGGSSAPAYTPPAPQAPVYPASPSYTPPAYVPPSGAAPPSPSQVKQRLEGIALQTFEGIDAHGGPPINECDHLASGGWGWKRIGPLNGGGTSMLVMVTENGKTWARIRDTVPDGRSVSVDLYRLGDFSHPLSSWQVQP